MAASRPRRYSFARGRAAARSQSRHHRSRSVVRGLRLYAGEEMIGGGWWNRHRWTSSATVATTVMTAICCALAALIYVELDEQPVGPLEMSPPGPSGTSSTGTGTAPSQPEFALRPFEAY